MEIKEAAFADNSREARIAFLVYVPAPIPSSYINLFQMHTHLTLSYLC